MLIAAVYVVAQPARRHRDDPRQPAPADVARMSEPVAADRVAGRAAPRAAAPARRCCSRRRWRLARTQIGVALVVLLVGVALIGPFFAPHSPTDFVGAPVRARRRRARCSAPTTSGATSSAASSGAAARSSASSLAATAIGLVLGDRRSGSSPPTRAALLDDVLMRGDGRDPRVPVDRARARRGRDGRPEALAARARRRHHDAAARRARDARRRARDRRARLRPRGRGDRRVARARSCSARSCRTSRAR